LENLSFGFKGGIGDRDAGGGRVRKPKIWRKTGHPQKEVCTGEKRYPKSWGGGEAKIWARLMRFGDADSSG